MNSLERLKAELEGPQKDPDGLRARLTASQQYIEVRLAELQHAADRLEAHLEHGDTEESVAADLRLVLGWARMQPLEFSTSYRIFYMVEDTIRNLAAQFPPRSIR